MAAHGCRTDAAASGQVLETGWCDDLDMRQTVSPAEDRSAGRGGNAPAPPARAAASTSHLPADLTAARHSRVPRAGPDPVSAHGSENGSPPPQMATTVGVATLVTVCSEAREVALAYRAGVIPRRCRKWRVRWLWSTKPARAATSVARSPRSRSRRARLTR